MIIYGRSGAKNVQSKKVSGAPCPSCESTNLEAVVYSQYAHVYWIPLFTLGKKSLLQCMDCGLEIKKKARPVQAENRLIELKSDYKIPIWHFAGIFAIALAIMGANFASNQDDKENQAFFSRPMSGDIYELKLGRKEYSTFKILDVEEDSIAVIYNIYQTNKSTGLAEIDKAENYTDDIYLIAKHTMTEMFEDGTIIDIDRN